MYNPLWADDDFTGTIASYDLSNLAAPVTPIYEAGDFICDADAAKAILDPLTPFSINWSERTDFAGNNDPAWLAFV